MQAREMLITFDLRITVKYNLCEGGTLWQTNLINLIRL